MIYKNNKTINEWYFNDAELIKVYKNGAICYYKMVLGETPHQEPCFAVVDDITQYSDTEFIDVYDKATEKWYKLNNLDQYEEYGIYGEGRNITYYEGKLTIDNGYEYEWDGSQWGNLGEVSGRTVPDNYVIPFDDSTVKNICVTNWGGNVVAGEITYGEAKAVTSLGSVFKNNSTIRKFNELAYFHGLTSLANGEFQSCTNLTDIVIPPNVTNLGTSSSQSYVTFKGCSSLSGLTILSSSEAIYIGQMWGDNSYWQNSSHRNVPMIFPNEPITLGWSFGYADNLENVYFQYSTPPANLANADISRATKLKNTYVPIGSYSAYNAVLSSYNKTVIEYDFETDSLGILDKEKEWIAKTSSVIVYPKYYTEKDEPENNVVFTDMTDALAYQCPWVGMDVTIDNTPYLFGDAYEWLTKYGLFEVSGEYICDSGDKYEKMEEMVRNTDGTWSSQIPAVYEKGDLIEVGSSDCSSRLPDGYTEVEYIQNYSATSVSTSYLAYLDTGFMPNQNTRVVADIKIDKATTNPRIFGFGAWDSLGYIVTCENTIGASNGYFYYKFGYNSYWETTTIHSDLNRHTFELNTNGKFIIDDTEAATLPTTSFTANVSMAVFTSKMSGGTPINLNEAIYGKMYSFKVYDNGTLVRDLVPCIRDSDNIAGAYDLANNIFYGSGNNNRFVAGQEV